MGSLLADLRYSARALRQAPGFTFAAIAALALGIGANTAIFSVVNTVLLKPFAYSDPDRIVMFQNTFRSGLRSGSAAPAEFNWWRRDTRLFRDVSAYEFTVVNFTGESLPEQIPAMRVSAGFFRLCGASALYGRTFTDADDLPNAARTAVLSYSSWQRRFAGDPRAIGRRVTLNGERYEIVGVVGAQLENAPIAESSLLSGDIEIDVPPDVYLPFRIDPNSSDRGHGFNVAGRLQSGVTLAAANARLAASYEQYQLRFSDLTPGAGFGVQPLRQAIVGGVRNSLMILLGAVSLVLLIACVNVASLLLARATGRKREIAIRAALGAKRSRIARQLLTESAILSMGGGVLGLAAGYAGIHAMLRLSPAIPRMGAGGANVAFDWRVWGFAAALSTFAGLLFGLVPAWQSAGADLSNALKAGGAGSGAGLRTGKTRSLLVAVEVALAVVLLIGAALLIRSFLAIRQVNPGFEARHMLTMRVSLTGREFENSTRAAQAIGESLRRIRALPGVEAAAAACCVPLDSRLQVGFQIAGRPPGPASGGVTGWSAVSAGYFETLRMPMLRGRTFTVRDEGGPPVAVVNETLARQFWPDRDPLQGQITVGAGPPVQIVGVVGDVRDRGLNREPRPTLYIPSVAPGGLLKLLPWAWVVRTQGAPRPLSAAIQKELREATGGLPVGEVRTMEEIVSRSTAAGDFHTLTMTIFAGSALLLASIGIYGLIAYTVFQRSREIGVRLALGADPGRIRKMIVLQGLRPAFAGVVCGLAAAFGLTRWIAGFLFGVQPWDPPVFVAVPLLLAPVALAAVWLPAVRAGRIDPLQALRHE